jgi:hypothetical protein
MDSQPAHEIVEKIVEGASTRAVGWILEQHCELLLNTTLQIIFFGNHRIARELIHEPETIDTLKSIVRGVMAGDVDVIVRDASPEDMVRKIIESASTRALGWVLEQHCQLQLTGTTLEVIFQGNHRIAHELLHENDTLQVLEQITHATLGRDIAVRIIDAPAPNGSGGLGARSIPPTDIDAQLTLPERTMEEKIIIWKGFRFRSQTEGRIAEELDRRKVLFFPNCKARLGFRERENREPDFLVCYEGKWGILEVDGPDSHPPSRAAEDHERDRLFKQHGILFVEHFDASECWENADGVVKKFLELLKKQR